MPQQPNTPQPLSDCKLLKPECQELGYCNGHALPKNDLEALQAVAQKAMAEWLTTLPLAGVELSDVTRGEWRLLYGILATRTMAWHKAETKMAPVPSVPDLDAALKLVRWGDHQNEDGSWSYGVANKADVKAAILASYTPTAELEAKVLQARIDELGAVLAVIMSRGFTQRVVSLQQAKDRLAELKTQLDALTNKPKEPES